MGILGRIGDLVKSNVNDVIDKAEHPEKLLKQMIRDLDDCIDDAKKEAVRALAELEKQEKQVEAKAREVADWLGRAELALKGGNEDMARKALERKVEHEKTLSALQDRADQVRLGADSLKASIKDMQDKATEARNRLSSLQTRSAAATATSRAQKVMDKLNAPDGGAAKFDKISRRIGDLERENAVRSAVNEIASQEADAEKSFVELEKKAAVDSELESLRNRLK